jgi:hypothetical protein
VTDIKILMVDVDVDGVIVGHPERRWHDHMKRDLGLDPRLLFDHFLPEDNVSAARSFGWRAAVWTHESRLADVLAAWRSAAPEV